MSKRQSNQISTEGKKSKQTNLEQFFSITAAKRVPNNTTVNNSMLSSNNTTSYALTSFNPDLVYSPSIKGPTYFNLKKSTKTDDIIKFIDYYSINNKNVKNKNYIATILFKENQNNICMDISLSTHIIFFISPKVAETNLSILNPIIKNRFLVVELFFYNLNIINKAPWHAIADEIKSDNKHQFIFTTMKTNTDSNDLSFTDSNYLNFTDYINAFISTDDKMIDITNSLIIWNRNQPRVFQKSNS